jgi:hypothetical protein
MATTVVDTDAPQCDWKTDKGRQCKLAKGHARVEKTQHGHLTVIRVPTNEKKSLSDVMPAGFKLQGKRVAPGVHIPKEVTRTTSVARDSDQKNIDKDALAVYQEWNKTKPKDWDNWPKVQYEVPKQMVDTLLEYIRATVNGGGPVSGRIMRYRKGTAESGNVLITWGIGDTED